MPNAVNNRRWVLIGRSGVNGQETVIGEVDGGPGQLAERLLHDIIWVGGQRFPAYLSIKVIDTLALRPVVPANEGGCPLTSQSSH